jgi:CrcB protein
LGPCRILGVCFFIGGFKRYGEMKLSTLLLVFLGGGLGSALRYFISVFIRPIGAGYPYATLIANLVGCFILGLIVGFLSGKSSVNNVYFLFAVGFCGGLTTFSSFSLENMRFLESGQFFSFLFYTLLSFALGLGFLYVGMWVNRLF